MRQIRFYFDNGDSSIAYYIDLEARTVKVGREKDGVFTQVVQDDLFENPAALQRKIANLLAIELNRRI